MARHRAHRRVRRRRRHQPFPFVNVAVLLRPVLDADDPVLDEIAEFYAPDDEGTPFLVWSATPTPSFADRGLGARWGTRRSCCARAGPADVPEPDGLEIVEVHDADDARRFDRDDDRGVPGAGDGRAPSRSATACSTRRVGTCGSASSTDEPVGTAAAHVTDSFVDVEWISTAPEYRGRRIGEALTWAATLAAPDAARDAVRERPRAARLRAHGLPAPTAAHARGSGTPLTPRRARPRSGVDARSSTHVAVGVAHVEARREALGAEQAVGRPVAHHVEVARTPRAPSRSVGSTTRQRWSTLSPRALRRRAGR